MRVSNSGDGVKWVNLQVTHRVRGEDFASIPCLEQQHHEVGDDLPALPRT